MAAGLGIAALAAGMAAAGCGGRATEEAKAAEAAAVPVTVGEVAVTRVADTFEAGGALEARDRAVLSSRVLAPVAQVTVRPGDRVRRGQTLVVLDAGEPQAQAARARASLAAARLGAESGTAREAAAAAALALARATHGRITRLFDEQSATAQERDEAVAALAGAESGARAAAAAAQAAGRDVDAAEAALRAADIAAGWTTIAAPFDGHVAARHVDPGSTAAPGVPLLTIESLGALELDVRIDARRAAAVSSGQAVDVRVDGSTTGDWRPGRVSEIARVDPAGHSFAVTIVIDAPDPAWRSGLFGRARFRAGEGDHLTMPAAGLSIRGQLTLAFVVDAESRVRLRAVSAGEVHDGRRVVLSGLVAGDRVVLDPPAGLADGTRVTLSAPAIRGGR